MFDLWGPPHDTARMRFAVLESSPPTCIRRASARSQDCYHKLCQGYHAGLGWCDVETVDSKICDRPLHGLSRALDEAIRLSQTSVGCLRSSIPPWPSCPELPCPHVSTLKRLSSVMQAAWKSPHDIHTHRAMYQGDTLVAVSIERFISFIGFSCTQNISATHARLTDLSPVTTQVFRLVQRGP